MPLLAAGVVAAGVEVAVSAASAGLVRGSQHGGPWVYSALGVVGGIHLQS